MLSLLFEVHFWTIKNQICISNNDFGTFKYYSKNENIKSISYEKKKSFACERDYLWTLSNKKPFKLKQFIKEIEDYVEFHRIVRVKWLKEDTILLFFNSGVVSVIKINLMTSDIINITFDKFLKDKLQSFHISDVLMTNIFFLCCYNDPEMTLIYYSKPVFKKIYKKISDLEPKFTSVTLPGPSGRRLCRKLCVNKTGDVVAVWWKYSDNDVFPWSPLVKDIDRANIHIFSVTGSKMEILCYHRTEYDLMSIEFSSVKSNVLYTVEQKISREGNISIENSTFEIVKYSRIQRVNIVSISLQSSACCIEFNPDCSNLLLGCVDGSVILCNQKRAITHVIQTGFVPSIVRWHLDGYMVAVASDRGQLQCFDFALCCIKMQVLSEDDTPNNIIDFSVYFTNVAQSQPPLLIEMEWNVRFSKNEANDVKSSGDSFLLLMFNGGPLIMLRILSAATITPEILVKQYLSTDQVDKAINLLLAMDWDTNSNCCLSLLQKITNYIFTSPSSISSEKYSQIQVALGSFYTPFRPINHTVESEFFKPVRNISRRLFHYLMRHEMSDLAFDVATYLHDHDLFMDVYYYAKNTDNLSLQAIAWEKAEQIAAEDSALNHTTSDSESCDCSYSDCSSESNDNSNFFKVNKVESVNFAESSTNTIAISSSTHTSYASVAKVVNQHSTTPLETRNKNAQIQTNIQNSTFNKNITFSNVNNALYSKYLPKKELVMNPSENLPADLSSEMLQGLLKQTGSSENKIVESKIKVVHFGVV